jgi:uncharacterized protein YdaU (DUF1376 family)
LRKIKQLYFQHDVVASRDEKILLMRSRYGARGYGLFWLIIEHLFISGGQATLDYKLISMAIGEDRRTVTSFLNDCIDVFKLFASDGQTFWSERLNRDLDQIVSKSIARSNAAKKRHNKNKNNSSSYDNLPDNDSVDGEYNCDANAESLHNTNSAIDNIREDEITSSKNKPKKQPARKLPFGTFNNVLLTEEEVKKSIEKYGENIHSLSVEILSSYKESNGKKYKSDYAAMKNWVYERALKESPKSTKDDDFVPNLEPLPFELETGGSN